MCIAYNVLMCRKESNHPLQTTPLFNSQCNASSGQLDPAQGGRMLTYCHHMAAVCLSCCIDVVSMTSPVVVMMSLTVCSRCADMPLRNYSLTQIRGLHGNEDGANTVGKPR